MIRWIQIILRFVPYSRERQTSQTQICQNTRRPEAGDFRFKLQLLRALKTPPNAFKLCQSFHRKVFSNQIVRNRRNLWLCFMSPKEFKTLYFAFVWFRFCVISLEWIWIQWRVIQGWKGFLLKFVTSLSLYIYESPWSTFDDLCASFSSTELI